MDPNHAITIDPMVEMMNTEMQKSPKQLDRFAGLESCCIFRVPQSLLEINKDAYQPRIVSIGPYYHGNEDLQMIQEHKWRYLDGLLKKTGKQLEFFLDRIGSMENEIRESYSESIEHFSSNDLIKMMVLDGVFIIELFRKFETFFRKYNKKFDHKDRYDPILEMVWVSPFLMRDFLKIGNQIPLFVLQELFVESQTISDGGTLTGLILGFFNRAVGRPDKVLRECSRLEGKHLLDFFRNTFIQKPDASIRNNRPNQRSCECACLKRKYFLDLFSLKKEEPLVLASVVHIGCEPSLERIQPATKLVVAGVKLKKNHNAKSFLDIKFQKGVLWIPQINMDDFYSCFILNGMIFEQCYSDCSKDITTYIVFLGCLINTSKDVGLLSENKIIQNYFGTDEELVKFFNNVGKYAAFNIRNNYLKNVFEEINKYCDNGWHVGWAGFKHTYFDSPWTFISAFAAFVLLCLASLQTVYTVYPYYYERK